MTTTLTKIGGYYHARIRTANGGSKTISTGATNLEDAERAVRESGLDELQAAARAGRLSREAIGMITTGRKLTITKALEKFSESLMRRRSPKTAANTMNVLRVWERDMHIGNLPPSALTDEHVDKWINNPESTAKAQTRRLCLSAIRVFMDFCLDHGWMASNPAGRSRVQVNMRMLSHEQKEAKEMLPFTTPEVKRLLKYFESNNMVFWQFAVKISDEIGLRLGDICNLEWDSFSKSGYAIVWTDKRDRRVMAPISDELSELLTLIPVSHEKYLFPEEREFNLDPKQRARLSIYFKRYCEYNDIKGKSFHCLRHGCITRWHKEGKSLEHISREVGHASTKTTKGYVH